MRTSLALMVIAAMLGCNDQERDKGAVKSLGAHERLEAKVVVLTKRFEKKFDVMFPGGIKNYQHWIVGKVKNIGKADARKIDINIKTIGAGNSNWTFRAKLDYLPAGETLEFESDRRPSPIDFYFDDSLTPWINFETVQDQ